MQSISYFDTIQSSIYKYTITSSAINLHALNFKKSVIYVAILRYFNYIPLTFSYIFADCIVFSDVF